MKVRGFLFQANTRVVSGSAGARIPVVHLYGQLESGGTFLVRDDRQRPYFYIRTADAERALALGAPRPQTVDQRQDRCRGQVLLFACSALAINRLTITSPREATGANPSSSTDQDRSTLLEVVGHALSRFDAEMLAYCLMGNHYHFVVHTRQANLSRLMRHVNGVYTQVFNRRHCKVGHLFQGRFKGILVDRDAYLLEVCRYVELKPVRADLVKTPQAWPWSSYQAHVGLCAAPAWLDVDGLHGYVLGRSANSAADHRRAAARYTDLFPAGAMSLWDGALRQQIYLGDEAFVERMQAWVEPRRIRAREIPKMQRRRPESLQQWLASCHSREEALHRAYTQSGLSMSAMAAELGLSISPQGVEAVVHGPAAGIVSTFKRP